MVERVCALCAGGARALRRVVSLAVCAAMVLTMVPVTARAATSGTHGTDITWSLDGTVLTFSDKRKQRVEVGDLCEDRIGDYHRRTIRVCRVR